MWRRATLAGFASLAVTAVLASAQSGSPGASAGAERALRLPSVDGCLHRQVRLGVVPSEGGFASLTVRVAGDEVLQLADVGGPGSIEFVLPYGRSRVRASAVAADGEIVRASRSYRRCTPADRRKGDPSRPAPKPSPGGPVTGGGEG